MPGPGASRGQRLRAAAQRVAEAIERVNQPLPDAFPEAALLQIAENLRGLGDTKGEGDSQVLAHARFRAAVVLGLDNKSKHDTLGAVGIIL